MVSKGETAGVDGDLEGQHLFAALPKVPPWPTGAGFGSGSRQAACTQITLKKKKNWHSASSDSLKIFLSEMNGLNVFSFTSSSLYFSPQPEPTLSIRGTMSTWAYMHLNQVDPTVYPR